ncbi:MAG: hypothetical protein ABUK08_00255 [Candidatus Humimicrobiaceae bacterium]
MGKTFKKLDTTDYSTDGYTQGSTEGSTEQSRSSKFGFEELGVAGAKISNGYVFEEFLPQLQLEKGRKVFREMRDNDATVSSILFAVEMILRAVNWTVEENSDTKGTSEAESSAKFLEGALFDDMSHTWDDFLAEVLSMLTFGWEYTEVVYKRRLGPDQKDPSKRSIYNDGAIGIRKLANRAQETLERWNIDEHGGVKGLWQNPPFGGIVRYIPIEKAILFRPRPNKGSPEGKSALRGAYRSWYFLKNIQEIEAIGIERELNGLPVVRIPNEILKSTNPNDISTKNEYIKMARDVKFNEQGGVVIPSDTYFDGDGNRTSTPVVDFSLMSSDGSRAIDTNEVILRYQRDIARTFLADFLLLGSGDSGSWALSKDKSNLFVRTLSGWLEAIAETLNRHLVPKLWKYNNFDPKYMPFLRPGRVADADLFELGGYIKDLAGAGATLFPDDDLENELRDAADLPEKDPEMSMEDDPTLVSPSFGASEESEMKEDNLE